MTPEEIDKIADEIEQLLDQARNALMFDDVELVLELLAEANEKAERLPQKPVLQ